jgi:hypothetical protein
VPPLDGSAASQEVDDENDQSHHQKQVNQAAANAADETHEPENQQNHQDCPKHLFFPPVLLFRSLEFLHRLFRISNNVRATEQILSGIN